MSDRARVLGVNAAASEPYWALPDGFVPAIVKAAPAWEIVVARSPGELSPLVKRSHAVVGWPFPAALARAARDLRWVHFFTSGVPDSWAPRAGGGAAASGVVVTSMRGENAQSVAEHGLFLALAALRGARASSFARWTHDAFGTARACDELRAAILGFGAIGSRLARLTVPLFREVRVTARTRPAPDAVPTGATFVEDAAWDTLVAEADVIFLALPLTPETRARFAAPFFARLKPGAIVVNLARGELVDEADVLAFLQRSPLNRYAADVAHPEPYPDEGALRRSDQVLLTPHVGARREDAWRRIEARTLALAATELEKIP